MTRGQFFNKLLRKQALPFDIDDVAELDVQSGTAMITLRNDEHPYIIKIEKMPIPTDYDDVKNREFFWKDLSGRGFTNTFTYDELLEAFKEHIPDLEDDEELCDDEDEENIKLWAETCNEGDEWHRDAKLITRIK